MAKEYLDKDAIKPVGVSQLRKFGGPVDLVISDTLDGVTDNFPMGLGVDDLFGAIVGVNDGTKVTKYVADAVFESSGKIYFNLGEDQFYYTKSTGRVTFVEI